MSQLIKKFLAADAVDATKIKLSNNSAIRARNAADSADINAIKVNASDQVELGAALNMATFAITNVGLVDGRDVSVDGAALDAHLNGGASKHDATEVDYERSDGSKKNIDAASDDVETAITDLDDAIGALDATPTNYTAADPSIVADHLAGIDAALASAGGNEFEDDVFRIIDDGDNTKKIAFQASAITTATTRTISMPDANVALGDIALNSAHRLGDGSDHADVADLVTLSGVAANSASLGTFTGATIPDSSTVKAALQSLETAHEEVDQNVNDLITLSGVAENATSLGTFSGATIADSSTVKAALQSLETAYETTDGLIDGHLDGGASKHDATEVDYERADGSKKDIQAGSDDVETALTDLDDNKISKAGTIAFTANQPMGGFKLTGLAAGSASGDSVRYEQAILVSGANAFAADQSFGGFKATNVATPVSGTDAANKAYVDSALEGLKPKQAVRAASTGNVVIASALEDADVLDGVTLATGDRVLLKDQTDPLENGIYIVAASGAASRSADMNASSEFLGSYVLVSHGTANAGRGYVCTVGSSFVLATDAVTFVQFSSSGSLTGGDMITVSGATISVDLHSVSGLESSNAGNDAGELRIKLEASNPSLQIDGSNQLGVKFSATTSGFEATASGLSVNTEASNATLEVNGSGELKVKFDTAQGLAQGTNGLEIDLSSTGGLEFSSGDIAINVDATNGTSKVNASNELEVIKKEEEQVTLDGTDITNQYVDLSFTARSAASISLVVEGGPQQERTVDYTVSLSGGAGGVTRITFAGDLATSGAAELVAGDKLFVSYEYL